MFFNKSGDLRRVKKHHAHADDNRYGHDHYVAGHSDSGNDTIYAENNVDQKDLDHDSAKSFPEIFTGVFALFVGTFEFVVDLKGTVHEQEKATRQHDNVF